MPFTNQFDFARLLSSSIVVEPVGYSTRRKYQFLRELINHFCGWTLLVLKNVTKRIFLFVGDDCSLEALKNCLFINTLSKTKIKIND